MLAEKVNRSAHQQLSLPRSQHVPTYVAHIANAALVIDEQNEPMSLQAFGPNRQIVSAERVDGGRQ